MKNLEFKDKLQVLIEANPKLRPFVCDGYPLECEIFIVGINPATSTNSKFLDHWIGSKFDKEKWFESYKKERRFNGKREISPTRRKIDFLVNEVFKDFKCLETNAYSYATAGVKDLAKDHKKTELFEFLLKAIKPKALFLYGKEPRKYIEKKYEVDLKGSMPIEIEMEHGKVAVCAIKHVRLVEKEDIESSAEELKSLIKKQLLLS